MGVYELTGSQSWPEVADALSLALDDAAIWCGWLYASSLLPVRLHTSDSMASRVRCRETFLHLALRHLCKPRASGEYASRRMNASAVTPPSLTLALVRMYSPSPSGRQHSAASAV